MSMFGLKEAEVAELVRAVAGTDLDREGIAERFARATWTGLAEPGDGVAGRIVQLLGAPRALEAMVERTSAADLLAALGPESELPLGHLEQGIARWQPRVNSPNALLSLRQAARFGTRLRIPGDDLWPSGFDGLGSQGPLALWIRGTDAALQALDRSYW